MLKNKVFGILICGILSGCGASLDQRLISKDPYVYSTALTEYKTSSKESQTKVIDRLGESLNNPDVNVRLNAVKALGGLGAASAPILAKALSDTDNHIRQTALQALRQFGAEAKPALPELIKALRDPYINVRSWAPEVIGQIGADAKDAIPELETLLTTDKGMARPAAAALGKIGATAIPALTTVLKTNTDISLRINIVLALAEIGPKAQSAVPELIKLLHQENLSLSEKAIRALGAIGPNAKEAIPELAKLLNKSVPTWSSSWSSNLSREASSALGNMGSSAIPVLKKALKHSDEEVRASAFSTLCDMGPEAIDAIPEIIKSLSYNKGDLPEWVIKKLSKIDPDWRALTAKIRIAQQSTLAERNSKYAGRERDAIEYTKKYQSLVWQHNSVVGLSKGGISAETIYNLDVTASQSDEYYLVTFRLVPKDDWEDTLSEEVVAVFAVNMETNLIYAAAGVDGQRIGGPGIAQDLITYSKYSH